MTLNAREQQYRESDEVILGAIYPKMNREDLFWARVDIGCDYLINLHGEWKARQIWRKKSFWQWFRQTWAVNDKKILNDLKEIGVGKIAWDAYIDTQHSKMMKWRVNEQVL